jgi:hypothetical protein
MYSIKYSPGNVALLATLIVIMLATRIHHFGSMANLPDASLAVFFLAGFYLRQLATFVLFCVLAVAIDYWSISHLGVSDFCVTPAYVFLLPTYFCVWWAGRWGSRPAHRASLLRLATLAGLSIILAFFISNGSFYFLSGYFTDLSLAQYSARVVRYFPLYWLSPMAYLAIAALVHWAFSRVFNKQHFVGSHHTR